MTIDSSSNNNNNVSIYRASILHFLDAPQHHENNNGKCYQYFEDGLLIIENGKVKAVGEAKDLLKSVPIDAKVIDYSNYLIMPGFIDTHIHYPQTEVIASYGEQLLEWLNKYVFPTERKYVNRDYAKHMSIFFLDELLRNGTTTAMVYSTVHANSADALFECAEHINMRIMTGKVLMDRNAPEYLLDTAESAYTDSKKLIEKWHGRGRLSYVVTPRFAPTSTDAQLEVASNLLKEFPGVYLQTHISENRNEVKWVHDLYPWSKDYTDVYDHFGLLGERSLFGHAVYFSDREFQRFYETKSVIAWCPTSNFFLGSGLFNLQKAREYKNRVGMGTDVGGGSSFSMLRTLNEAYKVASLQGATLSPLESFYYLTLGNARALSLEDKIGNFETGKEADFVVLDLKSSPLLNYKIERADSLSDKLFNLAILGSDRTIKATYLCGALKYIK